MHPEIEEVVARLRRQTEEIAALVDGLDADTFMRRPAEGRWAVAEHLAHLPLTIDPYVEAMTSSIAAARRKGWRKERGAFQEPWVGRKFIGILEPPPPTRVKTFGKMIPPPLETIDRAAALAAFRASQEALIGVIEGADGVDIGRARVISPFAPAPLFFLKWLMRFSVLQGGRINAAHTDRHLWLMREALEQMGVGAAS